VTSHFVRCGHVQEFREATGTESNQRGVQRRGRRWFAQALNGTRDYPTNVRVSPAESGLPIETVFLCFQLGSLDPNRFVGPPAGKLSAAGLERIETAVRRSLGL
jgi:mRNA-degrading endonuclease toxin of MazEF toxin-antitoxin module